MDLYRIAAIAVIAFGFGCADGREALAGPKGVQAQQANAVSEFSGQTRLVRRSRSRITVYPRVVPYEQSIGRSGNRFDVFPRPYRFEWPGPNAQRDCVSWLAPEYRPSGTVIVPRLRCRWVPG